MYQWLTVQMPKWNNHVQEQYTFEFLLAIEGNGGRALLLLRHAGMASWEHLVEHYVFGLNWKDSSDVISYDRYERNLHGQRQSTS